MSRANKLSGWRTHIANVVSAAQPVVGAIGYITGTEVVTQWFEQHPAFSLLLQGLSHVAVSHYRSEANADDAVADSVSVTTNVARVEPVIDRAINHSNNSAEGNF